jgi:hypothetical protein
MDALIPSEPFWLKREQANSSGGFLHEGKWFVLVGERRSPWRREAPPFISGTASDGTTVTLLCGLPERRLDFSMAQAIENKLRQRPGWRKNLFGADAPEWDSIDGHPVAVYWGDKRWASLLLQIGGGAAEILLDPEQRLDSQVPQVYFAPMKAVQMELF